MGSSDLSFSSILKVFSIELIGCRLSYSHHSLTTFINVVLEAEFLVNPVGGIIQLSV